MDAQQLHHAMRIGAAGSDCVLSDIPAEDTFGRVELEHAVTASNLFKYCKPCHGLVLFKHHHPLRFGLPQLADLLLAADGWVERAAAAHPSARHPFLLWNCGARSGASQFHGHAQVALSQVSHIATLLHPYALHMHVLKIRAALCDPGHWDIERCWQKACRLTWGRLSCRQRRPPSQAVPP